MNQYRVSLWIENVGVIPDVFFQTQTNVTPTTYYLVVSALLLAGYSGVRKVEVEKMVSGSWLCTYARSSVVLCGSGELFFESMGV